MHQIFHTNKGGQNSYTMVCLPVREIIHLLSMWVISIVQDPVVQSIVSLTSSLRGQLVKCFMTLQPTTLIFFVEKMREAFALQKLLTFFQQKILEYFGY